MVEICFSFRSRADGSGQSGCWTDGSSRQIVGAHSRWFTPTSVVQAGVLCKENAERSREKLHDPRIRAYSRPHGVGGPASIARRAVDGGGEDEIGGWPTIAGC